MKPCMLLCLCVILREIIMVGEGWGRGSDVTSTTIYSKCHTMEEYCAHVKLITIDVE